MEKFDVIVVGAGPSGNAAAYTLAKAGLSVLILERGEAPGTKNMQGAILYAHALEQIIPDFREKAPLERHIMEQRMWLMDENSSYTAVHHRDSYFSEEPHNRYTIFRARFDKWFSNLAKEAGALLVCETTVTDLLRDKTGRVIGVKTEREDGDIYADCVILADGVNSLLGTQAGIRPKIKDSDMALGVKEVIFLPKATIEQRFGVDDTQGVVTEIAGTITHGMVGTGFLYTNKDSISIGVGCLLSDMKRQNITPYSLLEGLKRHPGIAPLIEGGEMKEYSAHLLPEGGFAALPPLFGDGWLIVGDSAGFLNSVHREGSNLAMMSGRIAAESIIELKNKGKPYIKANLAEYKHRLDNSLVMADMKKYKNIPSFLEHNSKNFFNLYPRLATNAAREMLRVDGLSKREKQKKIMAEFRNKRSLLGLLGDAYRFWRAFK